MPYTRSPVDGAQLFYRDYRPSDSPVPFRPQGEGSPQLSLVFIHGWPMSSAMWEHLMLPLCESHRIRCIALDRRGFGKSEWTGNGRVDISEPTYETFAEDTIHTIERLALEKFVFVAASMGCGETLLAYFGSEWVRKRCQGFVWIGASLPFPLQTPTNPQAPSRELWDSILLGLRANRPAFVRASVPGIFGAQDGGPSIRLESAVVDHYERMIAQADGLAMERCVQTITSMDFKEHLERLGGAEGGDVQALILHGDSDQGMPYEATGKIVADILGSKADAEVYENAAHGLYLTHQERLLKDILGFLTKVR